MKRIISIIIICVFTIVGLYRPMLAFALQNDVQISQKSSCCIVKDINEEKVSQKCAESCYVKGVIALGNLDLGQNFQKQILKKGENIAHTAFLFSQDLFLKRGLIISQKSPPSHRQKISNYAYHTLIKIIKSNT